MLPTSQIPTDNLYKFMAIFGLVLFLASAGFMYLTVKQAYLGDVEAEYAVALARAERELLTVGPDTAPLPEPTDSVELLESLRAGVRARHERIAALEREISILDTLNAALQRRKERLFGARAVVMTATALGIVGGVLLLSIVGFRLWYIRVQVHLDRMLREQAAPTSPPAAEIASSTPPPAASATADKGDHP